MAENIKNNFLIKIESLRKTSYGGANFLKSGDIIVALNNQLYTFGEKQLTEELRELKKSNNKAILTILREETFFDIIVDMNFDRFWIDFWKLFGSNIDDFWITFSKQRFHENEHTYNEKSKFSRFGGSQNRSNIDLKRYRR